jgi:proline iminopeptidase
MIPLHAPCEPFATGHFDTGDGHRVYFEQAGNPDGIPVLFLHGGPGSGCNENHRRYFDPHRYRVVLFDQRGSNRSAPAGGIRNNTTPLLLEDIESLRRLAGIERWVVFGGSWGATLALLYAQTHPARVLGLIVRGTFLARRRDLDWFVGDGVRRIFPDEWDRFVAAMSAHERHEPAAACQRHILGQDEDAARRWALAWSRWAGRVATYLLPEEADATVDAGPVLAQSRIEMHYAAHGYFIAENQILERAHLLPRVPTRIIHGRRDLTCTLDASWALHRATPWSELEIVREGGHLASEPVMVDALVRATDWMAERLR